MSTDVSGTSREEVECRAKEMLGALIGTRFSDTTLRVATDWLMQERRLAFSDRERAPVQVDVERLREALGKAFYTLTYIFETTDDQLTSAAAKETLNEIDAALTPSLQTGGEGEVRDLIDREAVAQSIEATRVAEGQTSQDLLAFLADAVRNDRVFPSVLSPAPSALSVPEKQ